MNDLVEWPRFIKMLILVGVAAAATYLGTRHLTHLNIPLHLSWTDLNRCFQDVSAAIRGVTGADLYAAAGVGVTAANVFYFLFIHFLWRIRFLHPWLVKYPDLTGTWYALSTPGEWTPFTSIVRLKHGFSGIDLHLIRNQSNGLAQATSLKRTVPGNHLRLYVVYYSTTDPIRSNWRIPAVDHGEDHSGCMVLRLDGEGGPQKHWTLSGEYWTNKRRDQANDATKGTWGRIHMDWKRLELASTNVKALCSDDVRWLEGDSKMPEVAAETATLPIH